MNKSTRIYVDTNVILNFIFSEHEKPELVKPSILMLEKVIECKYHLVTSDGVLRELRKITGWNEDKIKEIIYRPYELLDKLEWVKVTRKIAKEATDLNSLYGIHRADAIHAATASMYDCWLVTFDHELKKAAKKAGIEVYDPRDLI